MGVEDPNNLNRPANNAGLPATNPSSEQTPTVGTDEYNSAFDESLARTLDLDTWDLGENLPNLYSRLEREIEEAVEQEDRVRNRIRDEVFPRLRTRPNAPPAAGQYQATPELIAKVHNNYLFTGDVEACDGTIALHDTLPITIAQIGVCLVSYRGDQGSWLHRLFRRDLRASGLDPVDEALELLERRRDRGATGEPSRKDKLSSLLSRGIMTYAERAVLLKRSTAKWRMGHGNPVAYELLTGSGNSDLLRQSLILLDELIFNHKRFIFVPSSTADRTLLTLGAALRPLEYLVYDDMCEKMGDIAKGNYRGESWKGLADQVKTFADEAGRKVLIGAYRASLFSPPQVFYAHADYVHEAALIAMADSALQEHRGFPMLIDLADTVCSSTFGASTLEMAAMVAYRDAESAFTHLPERSTR
jgi:hypothetical protein